eukprot:581225-Prorocentrum_minimum.AAC.1
MQSTLTRRSSPIFWKSEIFSKLIKLAIAQFSNAPQKPPYLSFFCTFSAAYSLGEFFVDSFVSSSEATADMWIIHRRPLSWVHPSALEQRDAAVLLTGAANRLLSFHTVHRPRIVT